MGKATQRTKGNTKATNSSRVGQLIDAGARGQAPLSIFFTAATASSGDSDLVFQNIDTRWMSLLKRLTKKDPLSRVKALQDLNAVLNEKEGDASNYPVNESILPLWSRYVAKLMLDPDKRVREMSQECHEKICQRVGGRAFVPYLGLLMGSWFMATNDVNGTVADAARHSFEVMLPSEEKRNRAVSHVYLDVIAEYLLDNLILQTKHTLAKARNLEEDEAKMYHERIVQCALRAFVELTETCKATNDSAIVEKLVKHVDKLMTSERFWALARSPTESSIRVCCYRFLESLAGSQPLISQLLNDQRWKKFTKLCFAAFKEPDASIVNLAFSLLLTVLHSWGDEFWTHVNVDSEFIAPFLAYLSDKRCPSTRRCILPLIDSLPAQLRTCEYYHRVFAAWRKSLPGLFPTYFPVIDLQKSVDAYLECLRYVVDRSSNCGDCQSARTLVEGDFKALLLLLMSNSDVTPRLVYCRFYHAVSNFVAFLHIKKTLDDVWDGVLLHLIEQTQPELGGVKVACVLQLLKTMEHSGIFLSENVCLAAAALLIPILSTADDNLNDLCHLTKVLMVRILNSGNATKLLGQISDSLKLEREQNVSIRLLLVRNVFSKLVRRFCDLEICLLSIVEVVLLLLAEDGETAQFNEEVVKLLKISNAANRVRFITAFLGAAKGKSIDIITPLTQFEDFSVSLALEGTPQVADKFFMALFYHIFKEDASAEKVLEDVLTVLNCNLIAVPDEGELLNKLSDITKKLFNALDKYQLTNVPSVFCDLLVTIFALQYEPRLKNLDGCWEIGMSKVVSLNNKEQISNVALRCFQVLKFEDEFSRKTVELCVSLLNALRGSAKNDILSDAGVRKLFQHMCPTTRDQWESVLSETSWSVFAQTTAEPDCIFLQPWLTFHSSWLKKVTLQAPNRFRTAVSVLLAVSGTLEGSEVLRLGVPYAVMAACEGIIELEDVQTFLVVFKQPEVVEMLLEKIRAVHEKDSIVRWVSTLHRYLTSMADESARQHFVSTVSPPFDFSTLTCLLLAEVSNSLKNTEPEVTVIIQSESMSQSIYAMHLFTSQLWRHAVGSEGTNETIKSKVCNVFGWLQGLSADNKLIRGDVTSPEEDSPVSEAGISASRFFLAVLRCYSRNVQNVHWDFLLLFVVSWLQKLAATSRLVPLYYVTHVYNVIAMNSYNNSLGYPENVVTEVSQFYNKTVLPKIFEPLLANIDDEKSPTREICWPLAKLMRWLPGTTACSWSWAKSHEEDAYRVFMSPDTSVQHMCAEYYRLKHLLRGAFEHGENAELEENSEISHPHFKALLATIQRKCEDVQSLEEGDNRRVRTLVSLIIVSSMLMDFYEKASPEWKSRYANSFYESGTANEFWQTLFFDTLPSCDDSRTPGLIRRPPECDVETTPYGVHIFFDEWVRMDALGRLNERDAHTLHLMSAAAFQLVFRASEVLPALLRSWWTNLDKGRSRYVLKFVSRFVTPVLIRRQMTALQSAASRDFDTMTLRTRQMANEVVASYQLEETNIELCIRLCDDYPLSIPKADIERKVAVNEQQWRKWLLQLTTCLRDQNGSILDGLMLWKKNVDKRFQGVEECMICFCVLHGSTMQVPKLSCRTCRKKFHPACLYKWFNTSANSTCPLCRNLF